ncbi:MAG: UDP-N-acetylglucosamine 2-epimerase (non-hydrolyzing) [Magnetococcales bacterium]|nr:UDP-N-acetylglucosamine 2-epimerase (non-hydrolyzing) [Magnetococcales bacterium]
MKKIMFIFGTRPEAIKMAPVMMAAARITGMQIRCCVTAQHRGMLDQVLELFAIRPDHDLDLMAPGQDLPGLTARILTALDGVLRQERPDLVLVHGDTTTTFVAALAAFYARVPVGHVEAGLRTFDLNRPFPEEANRQLTGRLAALHFAPTLGARENLLREGIAGERIHVTGNTVIDALLHVRDRLPGSHEARLTRFGPELAEILSASRPLLLVTGHRRENFGQGFVDICRALATIAREEPELSIVYPVHLNPNVIGPVTERLGGIANIRLIPPVDYLAFVALLDRCTLVLTDSGGVQEEAPSFGKPTLVMREVTERPEAVAAGTARLVGTDPDRMIAAVLTLLRDTAAYHRMASVANPFGDGQAAERIAHILAKVVLQHWFS